MFNQLGMLADLMRNAGKLRETFEKAFESLGQLEVEGAAGGGSVTAKVNGRLEVVSVRIDPKLLADSDHELLEDLVSAAVNAHYGTEPAVQVEYAPFGQGTGLCAAVATTAYQNEGLTLQPCSTPGTTVFIIDTADAPAAAPYFPIVDASTTDFTHPFTMTIHGDPAHEPLPQITLQHLVGNPAHVPDNQLWGAEPGPAN